MALKHIDSKEKFFQQILRTKYNDKSIKIIEVIEKQEDIEKGTNYCSILSRLSIKYSCSSDLKTNFNKETENVIHLIIKEEPDKGAWLKELQTMNIFNTESLMLGKILPKMEKSIKFTIGPTYFYSSNVPAVIIMDDLGEQGFCNVDRMIGFSKSHVLMTIETIAKFHASSIALNEQEPKCLEKFNKYFASDIKHPNFFKMIEHSINYLGEIIYEWNDEQCIKAAPKIKKCAMTICENIRKIVACDENEFCVLNHGDCWINNIMFKQNERGEPEQVRLLDYQMCNWSSPAVDLVYFLNLCPETSIKYDHDDFFIQKYLEILNGTMKKLKCSRRLLTLNELKASMFKRKSLAQLTGLVFYPKIIANTEDVATIEEILEHERWGLEVYKKPQAITALKKTIVILNQRGLLD